MEPRRGGEVSQPPYGDLRLTPGISAISSLNEAWCHILDEYAADAPLNQIILPMMRDCFFGGAIYKLLLLQKGHGDEVVSDITSFIIEEPRS